MAVLKRRQRQLRSTTDASNRMRAGREKTAMNIANLGLPFVLLLFTFLFFYPYTFFPPLFFFF